MIRWRIVQHNTLSKQGMDVGKKKKDQEQIIRIIAEWLK